MRLVTDDKTARNQGLTPIAGWQPQRCLAAVVDLLTRDRRNADARRPRLPGRLSTSMLSALISIIGGGAGIGVEAADWHPIEDVAVTAERFLAAHAESKDIGADSRTTLRAAKLDPRLQLPKCSRPLHAFLQRGATMRSRMTVGVRCDGARPWKVYVSVDVIVTESVVVAKRSLAAGHVLARQDLSLAERDVSTLARGYLTRPEDVIGRRLKQQLIEGRVLTPSMMKADIVIRRGQSVTITIRGKSLNISMEGKALMDGAVNQRIRVENVVSKRVVEGVVRSPQHVEVLVF